MLPAEQIQALRSKSLEETVAFWDQMEAAGRKRGKLPEVVRLLVESDLYYLLVRACKRVDMLNEFAFARCREVEAEPNGRLDLWAREHFKSSVITFGLTIQDILKDPEVTFGLFSHTRPIAKAFLRQIMREFEENETLHVAFPDILWGRDIRAAPKWSEDDGIIVKRKSNPKEATVEAWGLVDGQPTSKHYKVLLYDDVVVRETVTTPEQIEKTMTALEQSYNLGTTPGGIRRMAGTRWHYNDPHRTVAQRQTFIPREHPGRIGGTEDGESVFWPEEVHLEKRRDMGPYTYACHASGTNILMGDWSWKKIEEVSVGDEVVGFVLPKFRSKTRTSLVRTKVLATGSRLAQANEYVLESGAAVRCTPNHKWWSGRHGSDGHKAYSTLGTNAYRDLSGLVRVTEVFDRDPELLADAAWLAGMIDGEGTISPEGQVVITQSNEHNPAVCERLEQVLVRLKIDFYTYQRKAHSSHGRNAKASRLYVLRGGRPMKHRIITLADLAKREVFVNRGLYGKLGGRHADSKNDKVASFTSLGEILVHNIQTETGNYIAEGYASSNSQILLNPKADSMQGFKREWLRKFKIIKQEKLNWYLLFDGASSKKKGSDYTAGWAAGLGVDGNYYCVPIVRDRLNLKERADKVFEAHRKYRPVQTRYEKYGLMSDIEHFQSRMEQENYRFTITEVAGQTSKHDRIKRLVPLFEAGRIWIPESHNVTDWQRTTVDLVHSFIEEEYMAFPVGLHDDMMDALARIAEPDLKLTWPKEEKPVEFLPQRNLPAAVGWMAA